MGPARENPCSFVSKAGCWRRPYFNRCCWSSRYPPQGDIHTPRLAPYFRARAATFLNPLGKLLLNCQSVWLLSQPSSNKNAFKGVWRLIIKLSAKVCIRSKQLVSSSLRSVHDRSYQEL